MVGDLTAERDRFAGETPTGKVVDSAFRFAADIVFAIFLVGVSVMVPLGVSRVVTSRTFGE